MAESVELDRSIPGMLIRLSAEPAPQLQVAANRKLDWETLERSQAESTFGDMIHPTAVIYRDYAWRVLSVRAEAGAWNYLLGPWPNGEVMRRVVRLEARALMAEEARAKRFHNQQAMARYSGWYAWMFGFLPARMQENLDTHFEFDPATATKHSGMIEFQFGMTLAVLCMIGMIGAKSVVALVLAFPAVWMALEGLSRWVGGANERPCGLFLFEMLDFFWVQITKPR